MTEPISEQMRELFGLPREARHASLVPLIASLREAMDGLAEVDVTGVEPMSDLRNPRGWSGVDF